MSAWVRLWLDMPTDPKWRAIARKSGQPITCVMAVFNMMLVNAGANADERGKLDGWEHDDVAAALDMEPEHVEAIFDAMQGKVLDGWQLTGWEKRQPLREDGGAAERKRAQRQRDRDAAADMSRNVTQCHAPDADADADADITPLPPSGGSKRASRKPTSPLPDNWQPNDFGADTDCQRIVAAWPAYERQRQLEKFAAHHTAKGSRMADWQAAWKTWVLNSTQFARPVNGANDVDFARIGVRRATGPPQH